MTDTASSSDEERWEILERIGAHSAGELPAIEAPKAERLVLENAEVQRLAKSYARMLALLRTIGEKSPEVPQTVIDHALRQAFAKKTRACQGHTQRTQKGKTRCSKGRPKK